VKKCRHQSELEATNVTADDVFQVIDADLATEGDLNITEDDSWVERRVSNDTNIATTGCPGVVQTAKNVAFPAARHRIPNDQVEPENAGHLVLIFPVVTKEGGVLF